MMVLKEHYLGTVLCMRIINLINCFGNLFVLAAYWSMRCLLTHTSIKLNEETVAAFQSGKGYKIIYAILLRSVIHKWRRIHGNFQSCLEWTSLHIHTFTPKPVKAMLREEKNTTEKKQHPRGTCQTPSPH